MERGLFRTSAMVVALVAFSLGARAAGLEDTQGAWVMTGMNCDDVFKSAGKNVEFIDRDASTSTGIIIEGKRIIAPQASCTVERVKPENDHFTALLECADSLTFSSMSVSFKIMPDGTLQRSDPSFPDVTYTYAKCDAANLK